MEAVQAHILDPLKPYLKPITHNLPGPVNELALNLLGAPCHSALLLDLDVASHRECVSLAASKVLGIGIVAAASVVKVPQMLKLWSSRSAEGLSLTSYLLETAAFLITLAYNVRHGYAFSTYGETAFILIQDVAITCLILYFSTGSGTAIGRGQGQGQGRRKPELAGAFLAAVLAALYAFLGPDVIFDMLHNVAGISFSTAASAAGVGVTGSAADLVSSAQLDYLQGLQGVLGTASKLPQIVANYRQSGTGQLSAFAVFNYLLGSLSRIFTTLREVDDPKILWGFVSGFALNLVLAAQVVYYWTSPSSSSGSGTHVRRDENASSAQKAVDPAPTNRSSSSSTISPSSPAKSQPHQHPSSDPARPSSRAGGRRKG